MRIVKQGVCYLVASTTNANIFPLLEK